MFETYICLETLKVHRKYISFQQTGGRNFANIVHEIEFPPINESKYLLPI